MQSFALLKVRYLQWVERAMGSVESDVSKGKEEKSHNRDQTTIKNKSEAVWASLYYSTSPTRNKIDKFPTPSVRTWWDPAPKWTHALKKVKNTSVIRALQPNLNDPEKSLCRQVSGDRCAARRFPFKSPLCYCFQIEFVFLLLFFLFLKKKNKNKVLSLTEPHRAVLQRRFLLQTPELPRKYKRVKQPPGCTVHLQDMIPRNRQTADVLYTLALGHTGLAVRLQLEWHGVKTTVATN